MSRSDLNLLWHGTVTIGGAYRLVEFDGLRVLDETEIERRIFENSRTA